MNNASKVSNKTYRTITLEEHFATPTFLKGPGAKVKERAQADKLLDQLCDLGERRIADMDAAGIDVQILSLTAPGVDQLDATEAVKLARDTNDILADAVQRHPGRFAGFATLPTGSPEIAADELDRMVRKHSFKGAVINGHNRGRYLDDKFFWPILERAEALQVPLYLHPTPPPRQVTEIYYAGNYSAEVTERLATAGWGWHIETATHILRLILSGAFDRYPRLQFVIGHLGEGLPFMLPRLDRRLPMALTKLHRPIGAYLRENLHYTISGFNFVATFLDLLFEVGVDRIMFSADYPFGSMSQACAFLDQLALSPADKEKIAHGNAEVLLRI
ncbi:MAG TPA: amidohydrolase family protein [Thermodesulfobacteriota bacterium]|nr:amidohydrolase family protein [Thermodesulfobacteriota bacterium]